MTRWVCENHPDQLMEHEGCGGAGMPEEAALVRDGRHLMQNEGMGRPKLAFHPKHFTLWIPPWEDIELVPVTQETV